MNFMANKRVLLGVTGGIAAYKSAELVRLLRQQGAEIEVVMTQSACEFISPLTFQALSGRPVHTHLLDHDSESVMGHITLARWSDIIVVAPATANFIAKLAYGMADDLLSTLCLAADVPIMVVPAMNQQMWLNPATQTNANTLLEREVSLLGPAHGEQACGETGPGRMVEPHEIFEGIIKLFRTSYLSGTNVLVTAGPTREAIDPVRYITNKSSGRMGYAVAQAALEADANVTLVSGPVSIVPPERVKFIPIETAIEMQQEVIKAVDGIDIFISAAAVADYRCSEVSQQKLKKGDQKLVLELEKNPDIISEVATIQGKLFTVGFAAETERVLENAGQKLSVKGLDMIAANQVGEGMGFDVEENSLEVLWQGGSAILAKASKEKIARKLIKLVADRFHEKNTSQSH
jgi:phosphopantothenoylcysteine decarboxylase/phosphopantothenate--cysteine ligase